jgi:tRNA/tmRNA/rRNA uracil-C5-methylase (TrmA/RlmC/RlmD family)
VAEPAIEEMIRQIPQAFTGIPGIHKIYLKSLPQNQTVLGIICKQKPSVSELQNQLGNLFENIFWQWDCNPFTIKNYQWVQKQSEPLFEQVHNHRLHWLPEAFFQTNRFILHEIVQTLREWIPKQVVVWDLYCGIGTLLFAVRDLVSSGYGIEFSSIAISCAQKSAQDLPNLSFECLDLSKDIHKIPKDWKSPEVILLNPPRQGISQELMKHILKMNCPEIIYMSCNPITLERDLTVLIKSGYCLKKTLAFDMFPNTAHFEILVQLKK